MAIQVQQRQKINIYPFIIIIMIGLMGVWFYINYFKKDTGSKEIMNPSGVLLTSSKELTQKEIDFSSLVKKISAILENPLFNELRSHINLPLPATNLGKKNPFEPFYK